MARSCLGCRAPTRCKSKFVLCAACWKVAQLVCRREYDALPEDQRGPDEWLRHFNAFMTDPTRLVAAVCGERAAVAGAA